MRAENGRERRKELGEKKVEKRAKVEQRVGGRVKERGEIKERRRKEGVGEKKNK